MLVLVKKGRTLPLGKSGERGKAGSEMRRRKRWILNTGGFGWKKGKEGGYIVGVWANTESAVLAPKSSYTQGKSSNVSSKRGEMPEPPKSPPKVSRSVKKKKGLEIYHNQKRGVNLLKKGPGDPFIKEGGVTQAGNSLGSDKKKQGPFGSREE